jgi:topoisomerase IA-like protein
MKLSAPSPGSLRVALPAFAIAAAIGSGALLGVEIGILVAAFGALGLVITFTWVSVQSLSGDSPLTLDEALTLGQPSAEEEQKRAVLRALKDLEYERSVGKISDEDYRELSARYREDAKRLIERVDESLTPARERAEKLLAERMAKDDQEKKAKEERAAKAANEPSAAKDGAEHEDEAPVSSSSRNESSDEEERA